MQGVEILNVIHTYATVIPGYWLAIAGAIGLLAVLCALLTMDNNDVVSNIFFGVAIVVTIGMIICMFGDNVHTDEVIDTKYQVTVADEVPMKDFYERYEVIEQNGQIFTVKEKGEVTK